jgi:hypothetical protein
MWRSIDENWDRATEAIQDVPERHLEKLRKSHEGYWGELKGNLMSRLTEQKNDRLGQ